MKYILIVICVFSIISCNDNKEEEFVEFVETNEQGEIVGNDIDGQWAPRISEEGFPEGSPLISSRPAFPNPFSNTPTIDLAITTRTNVKIEVLDKPGNVVSTFVDKTMAPGLHEVNFTPRHIDLKDGKIYQLHISADDVDIRGNIKFNE